MPPLSDIVDPPPQTGKKRSQKQKRSGQPGHKRHQCQAFELEEIDVTWLHYHKRFSCYGGTLVIIDEPATVLHDVESEHVPLRIEEHRRPVQRCREGDKRHLVALPGDLQRAGLVGPRLEHP